MLTKETGLNIRHTFQPWDSGEHEEMFLVRTNAGEESIGIDFGEIVAYLRFEGCNTISLYMLDEMLGPLLLELAMMPKNQLEVFMRYIPSLTMALSNTKNDNSNGYRIAIFEECGCIAKPIYCSERDLPWDGNVRGSFLMTEALDLLQFQTTCITELDSFKGFSKSDLREIRTKNCFDWLKKGAKVLKYIPF